ncbi:hypothetical protein R1flu_012038 [Riccia fluitans]|uniref:Uncharacterized protein n=1 Tax=Riccia fluitans TaxID=41844 RepID=A0ABD1Z9G8_9MARC
MAAQPSLIRDSQVAPETFEEDPSLDSNEEDPDVEPDERGEDSKGSDDAERELDLVGDDEDVVMYSDSQIQRNVDEVIIRTYPKATHGFCFMVMPESLVVYVDYRGDSNPKLLTQDIHNLADHWAGNHDTCQVLLGNCKCITENWPKERDAKYVEGGETHKAVKDFLKKYITKLKMKFYIKAPENFISKTFHNVINKYATKRIHFDRNHMARLACVALDWNENIYGRREVELPAEKEAEIEI